jgi:hypothetical protein
MLHFIAGLWLTESDGITSHYFWETFYPVVEGTGKVDVCRALLQFFQLMIMTASALIVQS